MTSFDFTGEHLSIVDGYNQRVDLNPQEGLDLLHWLSDKRDALLNLTHQGAQQVQSREKRLEMEYRFERIAIVNRGETAPGLQRRWKCHRGQCLGYQRCCGSGGVDGGERGTAARFAADESASRVPHVVREVILPMPVRGVRRWVEPAPHGLIHQGVLIFVGT
jgi:hypothetical protein